MYNMGGIGRFIAEDGSWRPNVPVPVATVERNVDGGDDVNATSNIGTVASNSAAFTTLDSHDSR